MGLINLISFTLGFFWRACVNNPFWEGEDWRLLWGLGLLFSGTFFRPVKPTPDEMEDTA